MVRTGEKFGNYQVSADNAGKVTILSETPDSIAVRGEHSQLGTPVAIKVLHHPTLGKEAFEEEVRIAALGAGLLHPHIARVLDFGSDDHELHRVTEWCDGGELKTFAVPADEPALLEWFLQAAEALAYAHREGIFHGDLKHSNLLIARESGASSMKVTDFGFGGIPATQGKGAATSGRLEDRSQAAADADALAALFADLVGVTATAGKPPVFPESLGGSWKKLLGRMLAEDVDSRPADGREMLSLIRRELQESPQQPVPEKISPPAIPVEPSPPPPPAIPVEDIPPPLPAAVLPPPPPPPQPPPVQTPVPPPVESPPPFTPPSPPPVAPDRKKNSPVGAIAALVILGLLGGGGYVAWTRFKPSPSPDNATARNEVAPPPPSKKEASASPARSATKIATNEEPVPAGDKPASPAPETPTAPAEPSTPAPVAAEEPPKVLKVPGDSATISGALARCPSDGTIEVNGGVYHESLLITRPVTILASGDATLEDDGKSPTLLITKGDIRVSIRGLVLRNSQTKGAGNPEETPALMLVASGAKVKMEKCTVEGGQGDGMTIADHGEAELVECRVMKNRGFGSRISGGSSLTATQGGIQENGLGGVWVSNTSSRLILNEGAAVNRNSNNGVQATEGALVQINGGGVSFNRTNGVIALDAGTKIEVKESGLISDNGVNGIAMVNGATASISSSKIERNQNYGILAERSGKLALTGAVLRSNSMAGVFFNEGGSQSCRIERSEFSDHSEFGAAFVGGEIFVSGCTFSENGGALLLGKDTKGEISGNSISPGPLESAIVREEAGEVKETNNTIR